MDVGHQLAFINQNFNNIASVIGQNSFVIVLRGTAAFVPTNIANTVAAGDYTLVIPHNLGYIPTAIVHSTIQEPTANFTGYTNLPYSDFFPTGSVNVGKLSRTLYFETDATNLTIHTFQSVGISYSSTPTYNIRYYLLQPTAN